MEPGGQPDVLIVEGDRIAAVGPRALLESRPDAEVVDLEGRTLLPGFIDAHNHLSLAALQPRWADLSRARDAAAVRTALVEQARRSPRRTGSEGSAGFVEVMGSRLGELRFDDATWLPFASALERGITLAGSSDDPCGQRAPLVVSQFGATRRTTNGHVLHPEETVAVEDWLRAYTLGAATAGGHDRERGTLRAGKRADLVALDGGLEGEAVPQVWATWIAGELAFCRA
jgi:predicted amidohydrolase YtcJ